MVKIRLDKYSLEDFKEAYDIIDQITDDLNSTYGDKWGDLGRLGHIWSEMRDILDLHKND